MASYDDDLGSGSTRPFESSYIGFDPRLPSQRFESSPPHQYEDLEETHDQATADSTFPGTNGYGHDHDHAYSAFDDETSHRAADVVPSYSDNFYGESLAEFADGGDFATGEQPNGKIFQPEGAGNGLYTFTEDTKGADNGALLPPPEEMQAEDGLVLRQWKMENMRRLEEKERKEREDLDHIVEAAQDFKDEFYAKRKAHAEATAKSNRENEKLFLSRQENFHANAHKNYWKAVAELIPAEMPTLEGKARGKDKDKKKSSAIVNQGPKPGKPTDLTRMRMVLMKLKQSPPNHMKPPPAAPAAAAPAAAAPAPANGAPATSQTAPPVPVAISA